jgi:hypothetical protein
MMPDPVLVRLLKESPLPSSEDEPKVWHSHRVQMEGLVVVSQICHRGNRQVAADCTDSSITVQPSRAGFPIL